MKIKFLTGPKQGQIDHAPDSQETLLLVKAGIIEIIPYKGFRERLADEEKLRQAAQPAPVAQWSIQESVSSGGKILVIKTYLGEITYFDAPPKDCPPAVVKRWKEKVDLERSLAADQPKIEAAKRAHAAQEARERDARRY